MLAMLREMRACSPPSQLPYVHFDTFKNVRDMKEKIAAIEDDARKRLLPPDYYCCEGGGMVEIDEEDVSADDEIRH